MDAHGNALEARHDGGGRGVLGCRAHLWAWLWRRAQYLEAFPLVVKRSGERSGGVIAGLAGIGQGLEKRARRGGEQGDAGGDRDATHRKIGRNLRLKICEELVRSRFCGDGGAGPGFDVNDGQGRKALSGRLVS